MDINLNTEIQTHVINIDWVSGGHIVRIGYTGEVIIATVVLCFLWVKFRRAFTRRGA